jgi:hypothetical protein
MMSGALFDPDPDLSRRSVPLSRSTLFARIERLPGADPSHRSRHAPELQRRFRQTPETSLAALEDRLFTLSFPP